MDFRWDPYTLHSGRDFTEYWKSLRSQEGLSYLYILGRGFDPRMCLGIQALRAAVPEANVHVLEVQFAEGADSPSARHESLVLGNDELLQSLVGEDRIVVRHLAMWSDESLSRRRIGSQKAAQIIADVEALEGYDHVVIDISALPRSLYFTLTAKVLFLIDALTKGEVSAPRLHMVVCENPTVDRRIRPVGLDDRAYYLHGFGSRLGLESTTEVPVLWIPVLGEGEEERYRRIYDLVTPEEVCPILPWPARDPRRSDTLFEEFQPVLVDRWPVDPRNIIYAAEANPFDAYRSILQTVSHYRGAMAPLGGCKVALTALSSKLLSVAVLLAAYEMKMQDIDVGIAHVEAQGHTIEDDGSDTESLVDESQLFVMHLA